ncbi:hypothetical protein EV194_101594 [Natronoflexus pectinivorans]|uniref:Uncharacterized protein n=1 Tax=Natronoflexus pectinivorans TaxID=682526 RepID=A0A4R2GPA5_9BACT|nr:hypothetical protein EV194_101594 [Natronoflexus pectinivorans]
MIDIHTLLRTCKVKNFVLETTPIFLLIVFKTIFIYALLILDF